MKIFLFRLSLSFHPPPLFLIVFVSLSFPNSLFVLKVYTEDYFCFALFFVLILCVYASVLLSHERSLFCLY